MATWIKDGNLPNYKSSCGKYIAVYHNTVKGYGNFWVFRLGAKKVLKNALCVGGLPNISQLPV